jgi:RNA polymerase sigma-70 factor (ECF subfamily)
MSRAAPAIDWAERRRADLELATRCLAGDQGAQRALFRRELERVHHVLARVLGPRRDLEDLVQEAFIQIFRSLTGYRGEAQLSTWCDRVAVRVAYAYLERRRIATVTLEAVADPVDGDASVEQRALDREAARRLYAALERLELKQRVAFALHVIDGRPIDEVAELVGASRTAIKTRVWRAERELRRRAAKDPVLRSFLEGGTP